MKKRIIIIVSIVVALVLVLGGVALTLSLIKTKPVEALSDYKTATVYFGSSDTVGYDMSSSVNSANDKKFRGQLKNCSFSAMQAFLSGRTANDNAKYYADGDPLTLTLDQLDYSAGGLYELSSSIVDPTVARVVLAFAEEKTAKIGSKTYTFDHVQFLVPYTQGQIREVTVVAYSSSETFDEESDAPEFEVFKIQANTSPLYDFVNGLKA